MENKENIANISTVSVDDEEKNKKIIIKFDILQEKLIFEGYCKLKINGITGWYLFATEEYNMADSNENINFEEISRSIYKTMIRRIDTYQMINAFLHEVTEIEISDI